MRKTKADVKIRVRPTDAFRESTPLELALLDAATKQAEQDIEAALRVADTIIADHQVFLRRMRKIQENASRLIRSPRFQKKDLSNQL